MVESGALEVAVSWTYLDFPLSTVLAAGTRFPLIDHGCEWVVDLNKAGNEM